MPSADSKASSQSALESNVDRLLKVRAEIDEELRRHKTALTILFTDVVGSTAYFDRFGDTTGLAMLQRHAELASKTVVEFGGRVIKTIGDSVMAEFPDPAPGVRAAMEIQRRLVQLNQMLDEPDRLQLRIGMNYGPTFRHGNDIYGDAVNLAARITKRTGPGQILITRSVRETISGNPEFPCTSLGKVTIQGKAEKEDIFEVLWTDPAIYAALRENMTAALNRGELISPGLKLEELIQEPGSPVAGALPEMASHESASSSAPAAITVRYEILEELGRGGMGIVYKARDRETGEVVALKVLKPDVANDDTIQERFKNELRLARRITHKNVCRIYDFHRTGGTAYISMEFVDGESLRGILRRFATLPIGKGLNFALQICAGLQEAHKEGVVHRDLKPENFMIDTGGNLEIMDFGIARSIDASMTLLPGAVVGTPAYMSPEQAEGRVADARADIYAVGLILYEMFTGRRAFEAETPVAVALKQIREDPLSPRTLAPTIPPLVEKLILKCLEKDSGKRFQSVKDLEEELNSLSHLPAVQAPIASEPGGTPTIPMPAIGQEGEPLALPSLRMELHSRWPFVAAGALALLLGLVYILNLGGLRGQSPAQGTSGITQPSAVAPLSPTKDVAGGAPIETATLEIKTNPAGSEVLIDGKMQPVPTPSRFTLPLGEHKISLRKQGYRSAVRTLTIGKNGPPALQIELLPNQTPASEPIPSNPPMASTPAEGVGRIIVHTEPAGAKILVDGEATNYHSPVNFSVPAGKHTIGVEHNGFVSEKREVQVLNNSTHQFEIALKPDGGKKRKRFLFR